MTVMNPASPRTLRTSVRTIDAEAYWSYLATSPYAGYQQTPEWGRARSGEWRPELVGWFDELENLVGVALIRYRDLPGLPWSFAIIPQGPVVDWERGDLADLLASLRDHLRARRVFSVCIVPPLSLRRWGPGAVKSALADPLTTRWSQVEPEAVDPVGERAAAALGEQGWHRLAQGGVLDSSQPLYNVWLPLRGRSEEEVLGAMTRAWRKNIRKAERDGVVVVEGDRSDLPAVQRLYTETADRQGFETHPLEYFEAMWDALGTRYPGHFHLHLAFHDGDLLSANATAQAGHRAQGVFAANGSVKRQIKASNAVYAQIIRQALADGAHDFDIGGVADSLDADGPEAGLLLYKADMGGEVREYLGGWELVLMPALHSAFSRLLPVYARARGMAVRASQAVRGRVRT
ncbi:peptidoglycan bridge formation glycyltransferase FemA/FemB family protein [Brachybacterium alimentarium]|uniref:lipid II:glycine glycyltransferase FemX n=1 Tax=Brachybacterium alimentarium TaxID=47845 RepID=UPI000DF45EE9|nr:peptidoglycan bridge formation glycyltransferase FemA/FemB family protein [Brachybacterium alimentarium]RCS89737.1 peptidoglycan bridge formation glycyltransferase FemA/FemB family protein [Brachybacterium alimentarium]